MSRALQWDGCVNVRDLGGVALADGGETRYGTLFRADNLGKLTDAGLRTLSDHGIARIVDLRWPEERAETPPRDVEVVHISVLGAYDPSVDDGWEQFAPERDTVGFRRHLYTRWLERHRAEFGRAFAAIADADGPVVFHCQGGKDRTGIVAALLLRLAGATPQAIAEDYALSERAFLRGGEDDRLYFMLATPAEGMARTLEALDETYGSVEEYLRGAGVDDVQLARLKERLAAARA